MSSQVHPASTAHREQTLQSQALSEIRNPYPAMEGLYVYTANKLEAIRTGTDEKKPSYKIFDVREIKSISFWRAVFAEFLAQILFVFLGGASAMFTKNTTDAYNAQIIKIALGFGLSIMALIQMIGHVSGGHINPAVTIAMAVVMNISIVRAVFYVIAQCLGAIVGGYILLGLTPHSFNNNLAVTSIKADLTVGQGVGVEIILTFVLVFVIFGTTDPNRPSFGSPSLLIGLTVTLLHLSGVSFTGASMNPSRSLGSAVASNSFENHWVYWVGPILGGILAAGTYKLIINPYRKALTMDEAIQKMYSDAPIFPLQDENFVAIPRDYFKASDGKRANGKEVTESSNF